MPRLSALRPLAGRLALLLTLAAGCSPSTSPPPPSSVQPLGADTNRTAGEQAPAAPPAADDSPRPADAPQPADVANVADAAAPSSVPNLAKRRRGVDWPKFLGPTGDSKSSETGLIAPWPAAGPRIVWQREIGEGYAIGSVSRGRYFQFDRFGPVARLDCLNAETGEPLWKFEYPTDYADLYGYNGGPRASPVVDDDRVYIYGAEGMLHCLQVVDGRPLWKVDTVAKFGVIQNFFGVGSTPVVFGELLIVMVGGSPDEDKQVPPGQLDRVSANGSAIVAFDKRTGDVKYQLGDDLASYASLQLVQIDGRPWCLAFCRAGLLAFDPRDGKLDFHFPWRSKILESVNASTPVVAGNRIFLSETYGVGSAVLSVTPGRYDVVWQDETNRRDKAFKAHWNTPVVVDGALYGCSGRNPPDAELRCIDFATGNVRWTVETQIRSSLLYVDGHFVCLGEYGALQLLKVNPDRLEVISEVKLRDPDVVGPPVPGLEPPGLLKSPCWAAPILSHGLLYVRGDDRLVCLEAIPDEPAR